ncbi:tyrosine-type recombinase/integrase [Leptospira ryugenii]|uniref:tyrosine-type recombinase/integrase n=1 Tax=Leptospira ryugenii TaxID=1917863 RepID=UPI001AE4F7DF|nr:tyrosine-type recombinase/integrase [Leptospira ryugenii]
MVNRIKSVPGRKFRPKSKSWLVSSDPQVLRSLLIAFHDVPLRLDPKEFPKEAGIFSDFFEAIRLRNYSRQTAKSYHSHLLQFCSYCRKHPKDVLTEDIFAYLHALLAKQSLSEAHIRGIQQSLLFYFKGIRKSCPDLRFPRMKRSLRLPEVLSESEVLALCQVLKNPKHRLLLQLAYSSGLRVSEVVQLRFSQIDFDRKVIRIKQAKGKKDRVGLLANSLSQDLSQYKNLLRMYEQLQSSRIRTAKERPADWIFPGQKGTQHLSIRTAERIFEIAKERCGITKPVSFHSLRHAFATHLLEQGTDVRVIQALLGHESLRTTQIYTKVAKRQLERVKSPLDRILGDF